MSNNEKDITRPLDTEILTPEQDEKVVGGEEVNTEAASGSNFNTEFYVNSTGPSGN